MATRKMDYHHNSILWRRSLSRGRKYEPVFPGVSENICIRRFELLQVVNYCDESNRSPWEDRRPEARAARISFAQTGLCVCSDTLVGSVSLIFLLSFLSLFPFLFLLLPPSFLLLFFSSLPTYSPPSPFLPILLLPLPFLLRPSPSAFRSHPCCCPDRVRFLGADCMNQVFRGTTTHALTEDDQRDSMLALSTVGGEATPLCTPPILPLSPSLFLLPIPSSSTLPIPGGKPC